MKAFLIAGIIAGLTVAAVESLSCVQCSSWTGSCASTNSTECPRNASNSCTTFSSNFSLGENSTLYEDYACSAENCSEGVVEAFRVHISVNESFQFASQCCQGNACNHTNATIDFPQKEGSSTIECPACYGLNEISCNETTRKCYQDERCVNLTAEFNNATKLVLKGCSNISNSTCEFLSTENRMIGGVTFLTFHCVDSATSTPSTPTSTPTTSAGSKVSFTPLALASLLLLGLLL